MAVVFTLGAKTKRLFHPDTDEEDADGNPFDDSNSCRSETVVAPSRRYKVRFITLYYSNACSDGPEAGSERKASDA